jgi:hypothetical protein
MTGTVCEPVIDADEVAAPSAGALEFVSAGNVSVTGTEAVATGSSDATATERSISTVVLDLSTAY